MSSLSVMLKNEIIRLSRKELRVQVEPLKKANSAYRRDIAELKRQVALLQRQLGGANRTTAKPVKASAQAAPTRFVAKGLRSLRARLGVSAADFGTLAGASGQSIYNWESGKAVPRKDQQTVLAGLRSLSKKEAQARLQAAIRTGAHKRLPKT
jgi:DNA-binding transcriptional regulator YiaG